MTGICLGYSISTIPSGYTDSRCGARLWSPLFLSEYRSRSRVAELPHRESLVLAEAQSASRGRAIRCDSADPGGLAAASTSAAAEPRRRPPPPLAPRHGRPTGGDIAIGPLLEPHTASQPEPSFHLAATAPSDRGTFRAFAATARPGRRGGAAGAATHRRTLPPVAPCPPPVATVADSQLRPLCRSLSAQP
jgi:hypothetical protein